MVRSLFVVDAEADIVGEGIRGTGDDSGTVCELELVWHTR